MKKKTEVSRKQIMEQYADYILVNGKRPENVFLFCKSLKIAEEDFYQFYSGFEAIEKDFFVVQFENTLALLQESKDYQLAVAREKLLSFYYTFFEQLLLNRSLVVHFIGHEKHRLEDLKKLQPLKKNFIELVSTFNIELIQLPERLGKLRQKGIGEMAWVQLLVTLKFWLNDDSAGFEKTDIFIEKSVQASFELLEFAPLKKVMDLGKFLWKEKSIF